MFLTCGCEVTTTAPAHIDRPCEQHGRISLRDHFAGHALAALVEQYYQHPLTFSEVVTEKAYEYADAMLKARQA